MLGSYAYPEAEALFSSPLKRCLETCAMIYPNRNISPVNELAECDFGEFEGLTAGELEAYPEFGEWLRGGPGAAPPHGESGAAFSGRVCGCFAKIAGAMPGTGVTSVAIVTHGGVIATILAAFALPELPMHEWRIPPACGYTLNVIPSIWMNAGKCEIFAELPLDK